MAICNKYQKTNAAFMSQNYNDKGLKPLSKPPEVLEQIIKIATELFIKTNVMPTQQQYKDIYLEEYKKYLVAFYQKKGFYSGYYP